MAKSNYIQNMMARYGETWIVALKPEEIQRSAKRVFKDMIYNNINYEKEGKYFLDMKFLENLIIAATNHLETYQLYYNSVDLFKQSYPYYPNIEHHRLHLVALCTIYNLIIDRLNAVKFNGTIGVLTDVSAILYQYRNDME